MTPRSWQGDLIVVCCTFPPGNRLPSTVLIVMWDILLAGKVEPGWLGNHWGQATPKAEGGEKLALGALRGDRSRKILAIFQINVARGLAQNGET
ncbi:hypothetical protein OOK60_02145 [Trichothermofontia sichuanensis B231]|uniref:hypothetical protein n=1 Tax=Trichothermofontia sichuanensis TaxID=3045816 RepID=UPI002245B8A2|nr:hypothetical protein [Trichothermofontia sichuanensis]UZQ54907.1 hypothetical protein OOK60_02145 [Trichothermofontia sichuanensis B231]